MVAVYLKLASREKMANSRNLREMIAVYLRLSSGQKMANSRNLR